MIEKAKNAHESQGNVIRAQKLKGKIKGIEEQIDSLAEHLAKIPKDGFTNPNLYPNETP